MSGQVFVRWGVRHEGSTNWIPEGEEAARARAARYGYELVRWEEIHTDPIVVAVPKRLPDGVAHECLPFTKVQGVCDRCGTTLPRYARRWCTEDCRDEFYRDHLWQFAKLAALQRDNRTCTHCGVIPEPPEVDHIIERKGMPMSRWSCLHHRDNLRTLCHRCHVTRYDWDTSGRLVDVGTEPETEQASLLDLIEAP